MAHHTSQNPHPKPSSKLTTHQVGALLTCCTGIVLVSMFSSMEQSDIKPNTTMTDNLLDLEKGKEQKGTALGYIVSVATPKKSGSSIRQIYIFH